MTRITRHRSSSRRLGRRLAIPGSILACLGAAALVAASAAAQSTTTTDTHATGLQRDLDALVAAGAPGAILLVRNGTHTVRFTAGVSDIAHKTPIAAGDHFKIASLTKTYTATVVLQLVGEGKLSLDDSVQRRLPGVVPNGSKITIRQLLNHTSGLSDFETDPRYLKPYLAGNLAHYWSPRQLVQLGVSHKPLFAPGRGWSYSNTNYVVAQLIVERTTGKTLGAELKRRIFQPLHLDQTTYPTTPGLPNPYVHGYMLLGNPPLTDMTRLSPSLAPGSGGIVSTVGDIADFYRSLFSGRLLEPAQLQAMKTTVSERTGKPVTSGSGYGLGIGRTGSSCGGWGHTGELPGYDTSMAFTEDGRRQVVLMMNQDATTLAKPAYALYLRLMQKAFCGSNTATTPKTTKAAFVEKGDAILCAKSKAVAAATKAISGEKTPSVTQLKNFVLGEVLPAVQRAHDDLAKLAVPEGDEDDVAAILKEMQRATNATSANPRLLLSGPDPFAKADRLISGYGLAGCPG